MKTKAIIIVLAALFLASLLLSLNPRNAIGPPSSVDQDFYGWKVSARTPAYPNWPGDWTKGDLGKNWREMDWVSYVIVLNGYGGTTLPAFDVVFDFYIGGSKNAIFVDLVRYFSYKIRDPYPGSGTPNDVTPANFATWRDAAFTPTIINRPFPEGTADSQTSPPGFAFWRLTPNSAPGLANPVPAGKSVVIYFEAHLSSSFVWMAGKEYLLNQPPTDAWGGDRYAGWTTPHFGSGYTTGSNPQFRLSSAGVGQKTVPIPIPPLATGEIRGTKYYDKNADAIRGASEPGLEGWTINLETTIEGITFTISTTTAADGSYAFTDLVAATYTISEVLQPGWNQTAPTPVPPGTHTIILGEGQIVTGKDFGNVKYSKTTTLLSASEITLGNSITDTATVASIPPGVPPTPTGTVEFYVSTDGGVTWTLFSTKTLSGGVATSDAYTPLSVGTYYFKAKYLGDDNYLPSESGDTDEPLTVNKAPSTTTTLLSDSEITLGESVTDTVTVTGLGGSFPTPTGTVEFYVRKDTGSWSLFSTKTLNASGQATSDPYTPLSAGTWYFKAKYLGDDNYLPSESGDTAEPLTVNKAPSTTTTLLSDTEITLGESVTDTVTVTGLGGSFPTPTGTVEFYVRKDALSWTLFSTKTLDASGQATSDPYVPLSAGTWYFKAKYLGDDNYLPSESGDTDEPLTVNKAPSTTTTLLSDSEITLGESVTDTVTVTGLGGSFPTPTGTVEFYVRKGAASWTLFSTKTLDASGQATSDSYTPLSAGTWYFKAKYLGDDNYLASESGDYDEPLTVNKAPSTTTTLLSASEITLGQSVTDTVTVTGLGGSFPIPSGTVEFYVRKDALSWTLFSTKTLDASGQATSDPYTPLSAGTWYFKAKYLGDDNYLPSESGDTDEPLTVNKAPSTTTTLLSKTEITLGESVTDTVTVTGLGGSFPTPTGTVEFYVRKDSGSWTLFSTKTLDASGQATSDPYTPSSAGTWYFKAKYLGDDNYLPSESGDTDEPLTVNKAPTTVITLLSATTIRLGDTVTDTITISTTATGTLPDATGTWTVEASMDSTFTTGVFVVDSGSVSGQLPFTVVTDPWAPPLAGTWYFRATYSGDSNYKDSQSNPLDEQLVVTSIAHTVGYWKNHPEDWQVIKPGDTFPWTTGAVAGYTYMQILQTTPGGDASIILAQQYIAAKLNYYVYGVPPSIATAISDAEAFFAGTSSSPFYPTAYPAGSDPQGAARNYAIALATTLENYNKSTGG